MRALVLGALMSAAPVWSAAAQEAVPPPLTLTVRPSGIEETRAERLARRAQDLDFAFRSICRGCARAPDRPDASGAPFAPIEVLDRPRRTAVPD